MQMIFTSYAVSYNIDGLSASLEKSSKNLIKWFDDNLMKSNPDKCNFTRYFSRKDKNGNR